MNTCDIGKLRNSLAYDAVSGKFTWLVGRNNGLQAGTVDEEGYVKIKFGGRLYRAHRLAWAVHFGEWPETPIDHINGVRHDNRAANLRLCDLSQNQHNRGKSAGRFSSDIKGVHITKRGWRACIGAGGVYKHLGYFHTQQEAGAAYRAASAILHGEFARFE